MANISHMDVVAIRKSGIEGWEPYKYEYIGEDSVITGCVPTVIQRGPRKGKKTWKGKGTAVVVTRAEVNAEATRYAEATGNCANCYGKGEVFASWHHIEGTRFRQCKDCGGTGKVSSTTSIKS